MSASKDGRKPSRAIGRPRAVDSPETFDILVDAYLNGCKESNMPITLTGMILSLGLSSRESFYEYQNYEGFSDSVKRARMYIENAYETRLASGTNAAANIFALKNFGWNDKQAGELEALQIEKLRRELHLDDEEQQPSQVIIGVKDAIVNMDFFV